MHILLAGGTGVIGSRLLPALVSAGHEVTATTRRTASLSRIRDRGARGVVVDVYDELRLTSVVAEAAADLVMHQLTDLSDADIDANARLRRTGTANLVAAARAAGVQRMMVQSIAWAYEEGPAPATGEDPLRSGSSIEAMEQLVGRLPHATMLRYGMLYGPGTWYASSGRTARAVAAGRLRATPAITSFVHIDDVVAATVQAVAWPDGAYNIVDDEPAPATQWLPAYAAAIAAPAPRVAALPPGAPIGRAAANTKARSAGWEPTYRSWREGFGQP